MVDSLGLMDVSDSPTTAFETGTDDLGLFVRFDVDLGVCSETAILKTAYWFTDTQYVFLSRSRTVGVITVELRDKVGGSLDGLKSAVGEFGNRLLDAELRQRVIAETAPIREALVTKAFFEARKPLPAGTVSDESRLPRAGQTSRGDPVGATRVR